MSIKEGTLVSEGNQYKVFGPYKIKNNSSSECTLKISANANANANYTIKLLESSYIVGTEEKENISKTLNSNEESLFYIKVYAKEGININYKADIPEAVKIEADETNGAYFTVLEATEGYNSYGEPGEWILIKDGTKYIQVQVAKGNVNHENVQHLLYPHKDNTKFEKSLSLSWDKSVGNITINKQDDKGAALSGATFTISTTANVNWKTVVDSGKFIGIKEGTTPTYSADFKKITFVADSKIEIKDVPFGKYSVEEVESPDGYYTLLKDSDKLINLTATSPDPTTRIFINHKVVVDLALEKWVSKVSGKTSSGEERAITYNDRNTLDNNVESRTGDIYVCEGDIVTYKIRIYNHGNVKATATKILDKVPEGLQFLPDNATNIKYGWKKAEDGSLYTEYLADKDLINKHCETGTAHNGLNYNSDSNKNVAQSCSQCAYADVEISFKVSFTAKDGSTLKRIINVAEIAEYKSEYGDEWLVKPTDIDSKVSNHPKNHDFEKANTTRAAYDMAQTSTEISKYYREDDEDIAVIIPARFDLSLEKWVSLVIREDEENTSNSSNYYNEAIEWYNKLPEDSILKQEKIKEAISELQKVNIMNYEARNTLDNDVESRAGDIKVRKGDIVIYTIRVYNQGNMSGYATEIMDSMPEGLEFLSDNPINQLYGWEEKDGKLYTTILSQTLLKAHDGWAEHVGYNYNKGVNEATSCDKCDYRDIPIAFKVGDTVTENKQNIDRIINLAQITKTSTKAEGRTIEYADIDSVPGNYITDFEEGKTREDDEDIAVIVPEKFDLALQKWITSYTKTVGDQEETITTEQNYETTIEEKNNSKLVKIDLAEKDLNKTTLKIKYAVRVENEGEIPGYVKELTDYIPVGTEFHQEDNLNEEGKPYWTLDGDKAVTAEAYEEQLNTILNPGESQIFYITLRWINDKDNLGLKNNWVEISKDDNAWDVPDIDSDPGNMLEERTPHYWEDDEDEVPFLLTIKTGESMIKYALIFIILSVALGGALLIRRKVKNII